MITGVPAATPVTTPVPKPTVASAVLLLVQVPPELASDNKILPSLEDVFVSSIEEYDRRELKKD